MCNRVYYAVLCADEGSSNSGLYELQAVLTHKGRSSTSGHYVAWVRQKADDWVMFDDDNVSVVKSDDILRLSGGGSSPTHLILSYSNSTRIGICAIHYMPARITLPLMPILYRKECVFLPVIYCQFETSETNKIKDMEMQNAVLISSKVCHALRPLL